MRFPDEVVFNMQVRTEIFWLDRKRVLSVVDAGTNFCASRFLSAEDVSFVWNTFLDAYSLKYVGVTESILTDQGSVFLSAE